MRTDARGRGPGQRGCPDDECGPDGGGARTGARGHGQRDGLDDEYEPDGAGARIF